MLQRLRQRRAGLAQITLNPNLPLVRNLNLLAELLGLSEAEQAVLGFAVVRPNIGGAERKWRAAPPDSLEAINQWVREPNARVGVRRADCNH